MTEQTPAQPTAAAAPAAAPGAPAAPTPTTPTTQPETGKQPPWGKPENFDADKAWELIENLRKEKVDPALRTELDQLRQQQQAQRDALAAALGVKPEETSDADKLAQQIQGLQGQILASERRALAVEFKVPEDMLTASDADGMRKQAESLVQFAQAAHYAAVATTQPPATPPPAFQVNPGQGQGGGPASPDALADAEYEKYYPTKQ